MSDNLCCSNCLSVLASDGEFEVVDHRHVLVSNNVLATSLIRCPFPQWAIRRNGKFACVACPSCKMKCGTMFAGFAGRAPAIVVDGYETSVASLSEEDLQADNVAISAVDGGCRVIEDSRGRRTEFWEAPGDWKERKTWQDGMKYTQCWKFEHD